MSFDFKSNFAEEIDKEMEKDQDFAKDISKLMYIGKMLKRFQLAISSGSVLPTTKRGLEELSRLNLHYAQLFLITPDYRDKDWILAHQTELIELQSKIFEFIKEEMIKAGFRKA